MLKRNKFFQKFLKAKSPDKKTTNYNHYKIYRNQVVRLIRQSKLNHYQKFFTDNLKNSRKTWKGINELIGNKKNKSQNNITLNINNDIISNPLEVSEQFNHFLVSIANKIRAKMPNK